MVSGVTIQKDWKEPLDQYLDVVKNLVPSFPSFSLSPSLSPWDKKSNRKEE